MDGCKLILSARRPEASVARSQGKPKMAVRIAGRIEVCLSGCSSITECTRSMGPAPLKDKKSIILAICLVLELWASEVKHYLEIIPK